MRNVVPATSGGEFRTPAPADADLDRAAVHVWCVGLDASPGLLRDLDGVLCAEERARARRFRLDHLMRAYTAGRGVMRLALGAYLGEPPHEVELLRTANGKPFVPRTSLRFNISDSGTLAMFAFASGVEVGVDIEHIRPLPDFMTIASRNFALAEHRNLLAIPEEARMRAFYQLWTTKEACLKSTGEGLSVPLDTVQVVTDRDAGPRAPAAVSRPGCGASWCAYDVSPSREYAACLAVPSGIWSVDCWQFGDAMEAADFCQAMQRRRSWYVGGND